jgi:septal ring factor EnvC (AmiA/AmiB activator)
MGFLYCPNCGQPVSDQAEITACPKDFHPFNAKEWRMIQEQKEAEEAARKREKEEAKRKEQEEDRKRQAEICRKLDEEEKRMKDKYGSSYDRYRGLCMFKDEPCIGCGGCEFF